MAKRFGRNQKKKLKAKINTLEKNLQYTKGLLTDCLEAKNYYQGKLEAVLALINEIAPNSIVLPPKELPFPYRSEIRIDIPHPSETPGFEMTALTPVRSEMVNLVELRYYLESSPDFHRAIHFKIRIGNKAMAYAISRDVLEYENISLIAHEIGNAFIRLFNSTRRKK